MLFPRKSETREIRDLCGTWNFKVDWRDEGVRRRWFSRPLASPRKIPVPCSYNDFFKDAAIRDHVGDVWYERSFEVPETWKGRRIVIRFGSVTHRAQVWVNGKSAGAHTGGFLPFECDVTRMVRFGRRNRLSVAVSNVLDWSTLPPGEVRRSSTGRRVQEYWFDFFNYAGIHRRVLLMSMPRSHISGIKVVTAIRGRDGIVSYELEARGAFGSATVRLLDSRGREVAGSQGVRAALRVHRAKRWFPGKPYLYHLEASIWTADDRLADRYTLPVGIRTVRASGRRFLINRKPFYFRGFGKHEDSERRGRGLDEALNRRDVRLLDWIGANSFRTSHYPYSEEWLNLCDQKGIAVIGEAPAVGMNFLGPNQRVFRKGRIGRAALRRHLAVMEEMIDRDRNHPCIVMWSVANEPASHEKESAVYFRKVAKQTRRLDPTRPVTLVTCAGVRGDRVMKFFDVVCVNRYYGWYVNPGQLDAIETDLVRNLTGWHRRFRKPVFLTEFGADAIAGFHRHPPVMFSEEYQLELLKRFCRALDRLNFVIGEHVWNFADFATRQTVIRPGGRNHKGVFTRGRRPKLAAHFLRRRWRSRSR